MKKAFNKNISKVVTTAFLIQNFHLKPYLSCSLEVFGNIQDVYFCHTIMIK